MKLKYLPLAFALSLPLAAQDPAEPTQDPAPAPSEEKDPELEAKKKEKERLATENALEAEKNKKALSSLRAEIARIKLEKEVISERLALAEIKRKEIQAKALAKIEDESKRTSLEASLAKAKTDKLTQTIKAEKALASKELDKLEMEMKAIQIKKAREAFANSKPVYLDKPLTEDGTLVISDRRIALNGAITYKTADYITERINFYNNLDNSKPIFIVIDSSPGGSVMSGYRILKSMEASKAPIHVVVKSFAASMAACITTLAEESYAYPNALMLHHQLSSGFFGRMNLTEQKEMAEESQRWWNRLAGPIADKMGITLDEFIAKMYDNVSSGDWAEFGTEAQKLKWVNHIVNNIKESSILRNPDSIKPKKTKDAFGLVEALDEEGKPIMYLPRPNPRDHYFMYNPDGYYRLR